MTEPTMFADLLAAQKEMPALQKSAINPHFKNRFVPLDELIQTVLPILNKHNFVLLQQPALHEGQPCLQYQLLHASGESVGCMMPLLCDKNDPQSQGSAITYARRYSLMSLLGLTADVDDDAEITRTAPRPPQASRTLPPAYQQAREAEQPHKNGHAQVPSCPQGHGPMKFWPAFTSKANKPVGAKYKCTSRECDNGSGWPESIWANDWEDQLLQKAQLVSVGGATVDPDELPFE